MNFYLKPNLNPCPEPIKYGQKILILGSCFSNHMAAKMQKYGFDILENPYGIMYNPISILNGLKDGVGDFENHQNYLVQNEEIWHNLLFHGNFSSTTKDEVNRKTTAAKTKLNIFLNSKPDWLIFTFGSAYTWTHLKNNLVATNCHKLPAQQFTHSLLSVQEIVDSYSYFIKELKRKNPQLKVIFTVSPVRHLSLGLHKNNISKSTLHLAIHQLCALIDNAFYFPAYELVIDNLRDYRFYKTDKMHPTDEAVDFVWQQFLSHNFETQTQQKVIKLDKILKALNHRPIHANTNKHKEFIAKYEKKLLDFKDSNPKIII